MTCARGTNRELHRTVKRSLLFVLEERGEGKVTGRGRRRERVLSRLHDQGRAPHGA